MNEERRKMRLSSIEANELRLIANEIMRKLYLNNQREQLELLRMYADSAINEIDRAKFIR